jgi:hypothetical protein
MSQAIAIAFWIIVSPILLIAGISFVGQVVEHFTP